MVWVGTLPRARRNCRGGNAVRTLADVAWGLAAGPYAPAGQRTAIEMGIAGLDKDALLGICH